MFGFLNINKPRGISSRAAVTHVERLLSDSKAGHAGTLDPLADGVLVVGVGGCTRLIEFVQQSEKEYRGEFLFGRESTTEDAEGEITEHPNPQPPTRAELDAVLPQFIGTIEQTPPIYSALKVGGRRAYKLARQGKPVEMAPRPVTVHDITIVEYAYPRLVIDVTCGKGVYIRSLGRDLALAVGDHALMASLTRTRIGPYTLSESIDLNDLTEETLPGALLPAAVAVAHLPQCSVTEAEVAELFAGRFLNNRFNVTGARAAAIDESGELVSLLEIRGDQLKPCRNFVHARRDG